MNFGKIRIASGSVLVLDGDIEIDSLDLDGALVVKSLNGSLKIKELKVSHIRFLWQEFVHVADHHKVFLAKN